MSVAAEMAMDGEGRFLALARRPEGQYGRLKSPNSDLSSPISASPCPPAVYDIGALERVGDRPLHQQPARWTPIAARAVRRPPAAEKAGRCLRPATWALPRRVPPPPQLHRSRSVPYRTPTAALRQWRVRGPYEPGIGTCGMALGFPSGWRRRRRAGKSAASAWANLCRSACALSGLGARPCRIGTGDGTVT